MKSARAATWLAILAATGCAGIAGPAPDDGRIVQGYASDADQYVPDPEAGSYDDTPSSLRSRVEVRPDGHVTVRVTYHGRRFAKYWYSMGGGSPMATFVVRNTDGSERQYCRMVCPQDELIHDTHLSRGHAVVITERPEPGATVVRVGLRMIRPSGPDYIYWTDIPEALQVRAGGEARSRIP